MNDAVLGHVARVEILFAGVEIEPNFGLSSGGFGQLGDLVGFDSGAIQPREWQTFHRAIRGRRRGGFLDVSQRALNAEAAKFCVRVGWSGAFLRARVVRVENRIGDHQHRATVRLRSLLLDRADYRRRGRVNDLVRLYEISE